VAELRYKAWGETRYTDGTTPAAYKFIGQRLDESTALYYQARYYNPIRSLLSPRFRCTRPTGRDFPQCFDHLRWKASNPDKGQSGGPIAPQPIYAQPEAGQDSGAIDAIVANGDRLILPTLIRPQNPSR